MKLATRLGWIVLLVAAACGGEDGGEDSALADAAAAAPDASSEQLDVVLGDETLCPAGFTESLGAAEMSNKVIVSASCSPDFNQVHLEYWALPADGETVECAAATFRSDSDASLTRCRVNSAVLMEPTGTLTRSGSVVSGDCGCTEEDRVARAVFSLSI